MNDAAPQSRAEPERAPLSPRRRRLRITSWILAGAAVIGSLAAIAVYVKSRPASYRPDEQPADLTSSLSVHLPPDAPQPAFVDVTAKAGLSAFRTFAGTRTSQLPEDMGAGVAWGDFDNDGFDDVFLVSAGGPLHAAVADMAPCVLYRNNGNGTFSKVSGFPELRIHGMAAAWGDYDGDGFLDLIVTGYDTLQLFHNEQGSGRFTRDARFQDRKGFWAGAAWGDYDNDRKLDLYICGYVNYEERAEDRGRKSQQVTTAVPYTLNPASYTPGTNLLFHNMGNGVFKEVGAELDVRNTQGRSLSALWHDFDDDGWPDLYVANDVSDNVFYHNEHGTFRDISHPAWVADYRSAMGLAAGDFDRDGDDDLFITHWVAQENALYENMHANLSSASTAATNAAPVRFTDIADMKGLGQVALPMVGWGTEFADLNSDGWLDLVVANGSTLETDAPPPKQLQAQPMFLFWNRRGEMFHDLAPLNRSMSEKHVSRGLGVADFDNDGALDVLVSDLGEGVRLLRNEMKQGRWIEVRLRSLNGAGVRNGFADGTRVVGYAGAARLRRTVGGASYCSQSSRTLHFGLGVASKLDLLEVRWSAGATNWFTNLAAGAVYTITEGDASVRSADRNEDPAASQRSRTIDFWTRQRAAMAALKVENNPEKASRLFREALELNLEHEDSHYYLGQCLVMLGDSENALAQFAELTRLNPQSHRGYQQWGTVRAVFARSDADLEAAEKSLEKARSLNPEETGALLVLGEIAVLRGRLAVADERLAAACRTNPRATGGLFVRAYIAWKQGRADRASELLKEARVTLGSDWHPRGATAEGDVRGKQHVESSPLARFWERWDGTPDPARSFAALDERLASPTKAVMRSTN